MKCFLLQVRQLFFLKKIDFFTLPNLLRVKFFTILEGWSCKKCTLLNANGVAVCAACGGSRLKSTQYKQDPTLRKGEFWYFKFF